MYGVGFGYGAIGATTKRSGGSFDADAQSFFSASGITDLTQKNAVNQLVLDLKSYSLWDKMKAFYPVVGGNATAHSYNLKNTSQYQLSFSSGWTHSSNGMTPNGTSAYADTFFNPKTHATLDDMHISFYNRTSAYNQFCLIGSYKSPNWSAIYNGGLFNINGDSWISKTSSNALGLKIASRISNSTLFLRSNNINESFTKSSSALPDANINISRMGGFGGDYSSDQCSFASIGLGLSLIDMSNLQTIINTFQTTLSRQV